MRIKRMLICIVSMLLSSVWTISAAIHPVSLTCEYMTNPSTVDALHPRLSWINAVSSEKVRGEYQKAYRICVASSEEILLKGNPDIWDTGKTYSSDSYLIPYNGLSLRSGKDYWWRVMVWDKSGRSSGWSKAAHWVMGLLSPSEWKAKWIGAPWKDGAAPLLRKSFEVDGDIVSAKAFVSGLGYFELYINGKRIGNDYLVPNFTNYTVREGIKHAGISIDNKFRAYRVLYLSYDITQMLRSGKNVVGGIIGNGFYDCHRSWVCPFGLSSFLCQIEITYADGKRKIVCTDDTWKAKSSAIVMNGVYDGEIYDANLETKGWSTAECNDSNWSSVVLRNFPAGKLTAQTSPGDKVSEILHPISLQKQNDGTYLVDFGKEISGWIHFKGIHGQKGDTVSVKYICESPLGVQKYIFKGTEKESYAPRFTWYVFSKAVISGVKDLTPAMLIAEAVNTDVKISAEFKTSNTLFNRINEIWQRSQLDNMHGCIASDCPHRERSPYTGDGQVSCLTVMHNFDAAAFYQKWIRDMRDVQNVETGYEPNSAPWQPGCGGGVGWGAAMNIMPWEFYLHYGDKKMLRDSYYAMKEQLRYMLTWLTKDGTMLSKRANLNSNVPNRWFNLGDWSPAFGLPSNELVHTFYLWRCADYTSRAARALNREAEYKYYRSLASSVRDAFNKKFYNMSDKSYGDFGSNVFALVMGVPKGRYKDVVNALYTEIADKYKGHLNTGIFGTQFLFETLADCGMNEVAYEAMNKTDFPSYGNWIRQGATTTWEYWNGTKSRNHPMFGGGLTWFYRKLAGVNVDENAPGYKHIIIKPVLTKELSDVYYSNMTPYGKIVSEIKCKENEVEMNITIPVGSSATVYLPVDDEKAVTECGYPLLSVGSIRIRSHSDRVVVELQQGVYHFRMKE